MMTKLALRGLAAHRLRLVFTAVAVILGVSFVAGAMIFRDSAARSFDVAFSGLAQSPIVTAYPAQAFTSEDAPPRPVPAALLATLKQKLSGAASVHGAIEGYAAIVDRHGAVVGGSDTAHLGRAYVEQPRSRPSTRPAGPRSQPRRWSWSPRGQPGCAWTCCRSPRRPGKATLLAAGILAAEIARPPSYGVPWRRVPGAGRRHTSGISRDDDGTGEMNGGQLLQEIDERGKVPRVLRAAQLASSPVRIQHPQRRHRAAPAPAGLDPIVVTSARNPNPTTALVDHIDGIRISAPRACADRCRSCTNAR